MKRIATNAHSVEADDFSPAISILIAGAGIGGLAAAIGLRDQGHHVHVFEQSSSVRTSPYAIHLVPNGVGLLRKLGVDVEGLGSVPLDRIRFFKQDGQMFSMEDRKETSHRWQEQWFLGPRVGLHEQLVNLATNPGRRGPPVKITLDSKVSSADAESGTLTLSDGTVFHGDVILGADGVHSRVRQAIQPLDPYRSKHNCFRMMLDRKVLSSHPNAHIPQDDTMDMIYSDRTKTIIYPTLNNTKYNCVITHPTELTLHCTGDPREKMMELVANHHESFRNMFSTADEAGFRIWPLYDMDPPYSFTSNRVAILGDAAHPFTPHLAQGAMMALEDAASLSVMLQKPIRREQIPERLQLYNRARYDRSTFIQKLSLVVGGDRVAVDQGGQNSKPLNVQKSLDVALNHDESHASAQILREWLWSKSAHLWLQPTSFGPTVLSAQHSIASTAAFPFTATISYRTSATLLRNLLPRSVNFIALDSTAYMTVQLQVSQSAPGSGTVPCQSLRFYVHGLSVDVEEEDIPEKAPKCLCLLSIESSPDMIIYSREALGLPARYSEIQCNIEAGKLTAVVKCEGTCWAEFRLADLQANGGHSSTAPPIPRFGEGEDLLVHKFIPSMVTPSRKHSSRSETAADVDHLISYPPTAADRPNIQAISDSKVSPKTGASFVTHLEAAKQLPSLSNIILRLSELPLLEVVEAVWRNEDCEDRWDWASGTTATPRGWNNKNTAPSSI